MYPRPKLARLSASPVVDDALPPGGPAPRRVVSVGCDLPLEGEGGRIVAATVAEAAATIATAAADERPIEACLVDATGLTPREALAALWQADPRLQICVLCDDAAADDDWTAAAADLDAAENLVALAKPVSPGERRQLAVVLSDKWRLHRQAERHLDELESLVRSRTAELQRALVLDRLTQLPSRRAFSERLAAALRRRKADAAYRFGLIFLDVDRFKLINEAVGHDGGDELLRQIALRLDEAVRSGDTIAELGRSKPRPGQHGRRAADTGAIAALSPIRFAPPPPAHATARIGGDEFVVLLDGIADHADAEAVARRLLGVLHERYDVRGQSIEPTLSVGVTSSALDYATSEEALRDADAAMSRGKRLGKGGVVVFDYAMQREARQQARIGADLRGAAERGELRVLYQPIVRAATGALVGHEALVRWHHPGVGVLGPDAFIAVAEESGVIGEVGSWVLDHVAGEFAGWLARRPATAPPVAVSVNLSRRQLADPTLVDRVARLVDRHKFAPGQLKLELTESGVMDDARQSIVRLRELRAIGASIVVDDFGTGYSSLACLHQFPLDCVKLDRAFIRRLGRGRDGGGHEHIAAVIEAIVTLTRALGIELVAEGVETAAQWRVLRDLGCDLLQGFHFGRPLPAGEAASLVIDRPTIPLASFNDPPLAPAA